MGSDGEYIKIAESRLYSAQYMARQRREWWLHCFLQGFILLSSSILSIMALVSFSVFFNFAIWGPMLLAAVFFGMVLAQSLRKKHPVKIMGSLFSFDGIINHLRTSILFREFNKQYPNQLKHVLARHRQYQRSVLASMSYPDAIKNRLILHFSEIEDERLFMELYWGYRKKQENTQFYRELGWHIKTINQEASLKKEILLKKTLLIYAAFLAAFSNIASSAIAFTIGWGLLTKIPLLLAYPASLPVIAALLATVVGVSGGVVMFHTFYSAILENTPKLTFQFVCRLIHRKPLYHQYKALKEKRVKHKSAVTFLFYSGQAAIVSLLVVTALCLLGITALIGYCGFGASLNAMSHVTLYLMHTLSITNPYMALGLQLFTFFNAACLLVANIFFGFIGTAKALMVIGDGLSKLVRGDYDVFARLEDRFKLYKKKPWYPLLDTVVLSLMVGISICICLHGLLRLTLLVLPSHYSPLVRETLPKYLSFAALSGAVIELINQIPGLLGINTPKDESLAKEAIEKGKVAVNNVYTTIGIALAKTTEKYSLDKTVEKCFAAVHLSAVFNALKAKVTHFPSAKRDELSIAGNPKEGILKAQGCSF